MIVIISDYNGHNYTVVPCYVNDSSRIHYCGAYAVNAKTWRVIDTLTPKEIPSVAWDDLEAYVAQIDEEAITKASERNAGQ